MNATPALSSLHLYPVKSCAGIAVPQAYAGPRGLQVDQVLDRSWMLVDPAGVMVSQREEARLALVRIHLLQDAEGMAIGVQAEAPGQAALTLTAAQVLPDIRTVTVHGRPVAVHATAPSAGRWFSEWLGRPVHVVHQMEQDVRPIAAAYTKAATAQTVSLADGFQYLLASTSTLTHLQDTLAGGSGSPIPMARFRPNLVVSGSAPDAEYSWRHLTIGAAQFALVKACERCVVTTIDQDIGERTGKQPLAALARSHFLDMAAPDGSRIHGAVFGENAVPVVTGLIRVGDVVTVLECGTPRPFRPAR